MNYKIFLYILLSLIAYSCTVSTLNKTPTAISIPKNNYKNSGFALIYNNDLKNVKKLENRSLDIYHKSLKKGLK